MVQGNDTQLFSVLSQYGYPLLEPDQMADPNKLLASLSKSQDSRLLEGFPVVLANALDKHGEKVDFAASEKLLPDAASRRRFRELAALSFYLFGLFSLDHLKLKGYKPNAGRLRLPKTLDLDRVKRTFLRYYMQSRGAETAENKARLREDFRREYYLSLFFAPKQRDLLQKKLRGESLTKTEREYFSRVVKKKLMALADPDLHRLAQKALQ